MFPYPHTPTSLAASSMAQSSPPASHDSASAPPHFSLSRYSGRGQGEGSSAFPTTTENTQTHDTPYPASPLLRSSPHPKTTPNAAHHASPPASPDRACQSPPHPPAASIANTSDRNTALPHTSASPPPSYRPRSSDPPPGDFLPTAFRRSRACPPWRPLPCIRNAGGSGTPAQSRPSLQPR